MDYSNIINELSKASLFDLHRLHVAISLELGNPDRLAALKHSLYIGMELSYFYPVENRSLKAKVLELKQKHAVIFDFEQQKMFTIPYYMLNIDGVDTSIRENSDALTANHLKVGDCVGFNNEGADIVGIIKRLNSRTVTLITPSGGRWRVAYSYLYKVHDAEILSEQLSKQTITGAICHE